MGVGRVGHERERSAPLAEWKPWGGAFGASIGGAAMHNVAVHGAVALRALTDGKMFAKCVPRHPTVAICSRDAFPGGNPWQFLRSMYPKRGLGREKRPSARGLGAAEQRERPQPLRHGPIGSQRASAAASAASSAGRAAAP